MQIAERIRIIPGARYDISESTSFAGAPFPLQAALFDIDGTVVGKNHAIAPRTKEAASFITTTVDEGGVGLAIEKLFL